MKVFWSWQNDYSPKANRHFIRNALSEALERAGDELGLEDAERPELDHDTKNTAGMVEITNTIFRKISRSAVFVADLTPVAATPAGKALPNPNVLIELGWALSELGEGRIIPILNTASGYKPDDLPFDIRHRRALTYELAEGADTAAQRKAYERLVGDLAGALSTNLREYTEEQAAVAQITSIPAKPDDPSIWATASEKLTWHDSMSGDRNVAFPTVPRGYLRIVPASWKNDIPAVSDIARRPDDETVKPVAQGTSSGDFGPCEEGFVHLWFTGEDASGELESRNVAMWFDETGEYWVVHGTAIHDWKYEKSSLNVHRLLTGWEQALRAGMKALDRLGATPVRRVEAGLVGIRGVMWPADFRAYSSPARKERTIIQVQQRDWSGDAQLAFLTDAYNRIRDNFALPRAERKDVEKLLRS